MGRRQVLRREGEKEEVDQGLWEEDKYIGEKEEADQGLWEEDKYIGEKEEVDQGLWGEGKYIGEKERRRKWTKACGKKTST